MSTDELPKRIFYFTKQQDSFKAAVEKLAA